MKRAIQNLSIGLLATCFVPIPASASNEDPGVTVNIVDVVPAGSHDGVDLAQFEPLSEDVLEDQRGGFIFQGMDVTFGAEVRTFLDGELVLQTNIFVDNAVNISQVISPALTQVDPASLPNGMLDTGSIHLAVTGGDQLFIANGGDTALLHRVDGALQNILVNTMNGITGRQEIDASLGLTNSDAFRSGVATDNAMQQVHSTLVQSASGGFGL